MNIISWKRIRLPPVRISVRLTIDMMCGKSHNEAHNEQGSHLPEISFDQVSAILILIIHVALPVLNDLKE